MLDAGALALIKKNIYALLDLRVRHDKKKTHLVRLITDVISDVRIVISTKCLFS